MRISTLFSILLEFLFLCYVGNSCTRIVVDGSEEDGLDWINGVFEIDFGLRMDDRLTYKEVNGTRVIYHYSGSATNKEREPGRWILGTTETIGSDNGWAFRLSWSISPDDFNAGSFQNNEDSGFVWTIFADGEWVEHEQLHFRCESKFGDHDPMHDFLFVTTDDHFEDSELTPQAIHGFYIRVNGDTFIKISGSERVFYQEKENVSEIFAAKAQDNGLPVTSAPIKSKLSRAVSNSTWTLHTANNRMVNNVSVTVLQTDGDAEENDLETIYDIMRRYYRELRLEHEKEKEKETQMFGLNNGLIFPMITLGTGGLNGKTSYQVVKEAVLQFNYTAIDSARLYESETAIGTLVTENKRLRSKLFLVSKVAPTHLYFQAALDSVQQSLLAMKTNHIDLYTIHWPACDGNLTFVDCRDNKDGKWQQAYDALSKLYGEGIILNLGVSNWDQNLMIQLLQQFPVKPQIVQNHMDLTDLEWEFHDFLVENHILLQAYGTFRGIAEAKGQEYNEWKNILLQMCEEIKQEQGIQVFPTQLMLRFLVENEVAVISRTSKSQHLKENNDIFTFEFTNDINLQLGGQGDKEEL